MKTTIALLAGMALLAAATSVYAGPNTSRFLPGGSAANMSRMMAKGSRLQQGGSPGQGYYDCNAGVDIGNIEIPRGARAPREVNVIVQGNVSNVGENFGRALCR